MNLLKSEINEIIFSSPSGKMDTDFFTFCLILERKKNNKKPPRVGLEPTKSWVEAHRANHYTTDAI